MRQNHKFTIIMAVALLCIVILFLLWAASPALAVGTTRQEALHEAAEILRAAGYKNDDAVIKTLSEQWWIEEKRPWREDVPLSAELQAALTAYNRGHDDGSRYYAGVVLRNAEKWGYENG